MRLSLSACFEKNSNAASNRQSNRRESETVRSKSGGNLNPDPTSRRNIRPGDSSPQCVVTANWDIKKAVPIKVTQLTAKRERMHHLNRNRPLLTDENLDGL